MAGCSKGICAQLASKAEEYGACAALAFDLADKREKRRQREEEKEFWDREFQKQMAEWERRDSERYEAYRQISDKFEQKERAINLWSNGNYASEDEMYLMGKRDKDDFDIYSLWKDKKINDILNKK